MYISLFSLYILEWRFAKTSIEGASRSPHTDGFHKPPLNREGFGKPLYGRALCTRTYTHFIFSHRYGGTLHCLHAEGFRKPLALRGFMKPLKKWGFAKPLGTCRHIHTQICSFWFFFSYKLVGQYAKTPKQAALWGPHILLGIAWNAQLCKEMSYMPTHNPR